MQTTITILVSIAVPALAFWINWVARLRLGYALSAAAAFVLAIAAFDAAAICAHGVFEQAMPNTVFQQNFVQLFFVLTVFTLIVWQQWFLRLEDGLGKLQALPVTRTNEVQKKSILAWLCVGAVMAPHVFVFVYGS